MITSEDLLKKVKDLMDIAETDIYDNKLKTFIAGSMTKLEGEGIPIPENIKWKYMEQYIICIWLNVTMSFDIGMDYEKLNILYFSNVGTLQNLLGGGGNA